MNKKGFTLIELLAVIIILGILMIIAIPSVTRYINDSRKSAYVNTAKQVANAAKNLVNSGELEMYDTSVAYYIPNTCIRVENGEKAKSPYGEFVDDRTYVVVTYDGQGYDYYWVSLDETGIGVKEPISIDRLNEDNIESNLKKDDVKDNIGLGKGKVIIFNSNCSSSVPKDAFSDAICKRAIELHYETCNRTDSRACRYNNRYSRDETITYGNLGTKGTLSSGDAFDCDVNGDGEFDSETERFYYISDEYNTNTRSFDDSKAVLIYYSNVSNGIPNAINLYAYSNVQDLQEVDSSVTTYDNFHGPVTAIKQLPSNGLWKNGKLIRIGTRQMINEIGTDITLYYGRSKQLLNVNYSNITSRLLAIQEVMQGCNISQLQTWNKDELINCQYLLENTQYTINNNSINTVKNWWLETPSYSESNGAWMIDCINGYVTLSIRPDESYYGVRPAIVVSKTNIDY